MAHHSPQQIAFARRLRRAQTPAEARLWSRLRDRALGGHKFARQEPIGRFVVDFVCRDSRLVVEVDGATHSTDRERAHDRAREECLAAEGYATLRFTNVELRENLQGVLETILARLDAG
jgi:very-short-patch-repair endonuclease